MEEDDILEEEEGEWARYAVEIPDDLDDDDYDDDELDARVERVRRKKRARVDRGNFFGV